MRARGTTLHTAILGLLSETPLHGYELRKRLNMLLGSFRALSYGSLYPALKALEAYGYIETDTNLGASRLSAVQTKRSRIVYELTPTGESHWHELIAGAGPDDWEDESFDVRFAFFGQTDRNTRINVLQGRRLKLTERLEGMKKMALERVGGQPYDEFKTELRRHTIEQLEQELSWLDDLIEVEKKRAHVQSS